MWADSFIGRVVAVMSRRAPAFLPTAQTTIIPNWSDCLERRLKEKQVSRAADDLVKVSGEAVQLRREDATGRTEAGESWKERVHDSGLGMDAIAAELQLLERQVDSRTQTSALSRTLVLMLAIAVFLNNVAMTAVATNLPTLTRELHQPGQWLRLAGPYVTGAAATAIIIGGSQHAKRVAHYVTLSALLLGSVGAMTATSTEQMSVWRFLQGVGSFGLISLVMHANRISQARERIVLLSFHSAAAFCGLLLGPLLGGLLVTQNPLFGLSGWQLAFPLPACAAAISLLLVQRIDGFTVTTPQSRLRWGVALVFTVSTLSSISFSSRSIPFAALLLGSGMVGSVSIFLISQWSSRRFSPSLVTSAYRPSPRTLFIVFNVAITAAAEAVCVAMAPFILLRVEGATVLQSGLLLSLMAFAASVAATTRHRLRKSVRSPRPLWIAYLLLLCLGFTLLSLPFLHSGPLSLMTIPLFLLGLGFGGVGASTVDLVEFIPTGEFWVWEATQLGRHMATAGLLVVAFLMPEGAVFPMCASVTLIGLAAALTSRW
ncbi:MFS transporter [Streptomyces sp. NPDC005648]|uniref:MFS transporter n=1 Tax=Streptomyces sp. NPDC005648 TaxID=3157044 RepID=UPI0033AD0CE7